ncbi:septum site-determining protein Ssd [Streptomyces sp. NBC_00572]|uniref:septum site-determining protein Ssd n=1 Tax=Streptomyces sp. NBC_00572 TaxID=2903664 RepID=UPI002257F747|nr:septum site-determining protein Ssd [Streptomyces sp. NBC_00572]MCX4981748.1 septum formation initiator [Streptomyces sp. NBC_00572]
MEAFRTSGARGTAWAEVPRGADLAVPSGPARVSVPGGPEPHGAEEPRRTGPLIVTEDLGLLDDLLRLCAAAGVEPEVHHRVPERRASWTDPPLVLVGDDVAARCRGAARRPGTVLVGRDHDDPGVWRLAVEIGAECVLRLPDAEGLLVDRIADAAEGVGRQALTVGVVGGRGGAGASTLACGLALAAARAGRRTLLVDGDPLGGGLDVLLGGEREEGRRWPDFAASKGRLAGGALEESLPSVRGVRVLSWGREPAAPVPPEAVRSVLGAARRRGGVVVVDLPRAADPAAAEALAQLDLGLLVVPGELRAVVAAHRVASTLAMGVRDLRAVVRGPYAAGLDERWVADALRLPLTGELPYDPGIVADQDAGMPPGAEPRGPLGRFCDAFWMQALAPGGEA